MVYVQWHIQKVFQHLIDFLCPGPREVQGTIQLEWHLSVYMRFNPGGRGGCITSKILYKMYHYCYGLFRKVAIYKYTYFQSYNSFPPAWGDLGGRGVRTPPPWNLQSLISPDITGYEKNSYFSYLCTSTVIRQTESIHKITINN